MPSHPHHRPAAKRSRAAFEEIESRLMLSGVIPVTSSSFIFDTTDSPVAVAPPTPHLPVSGNTTPLGGPTPISPLTAQSTTLIDLDDFRADQRFSGIDGSGFSAVILDTGIDRNHSFFGPDLNGNGIADRIVYSYDFGDNDADASDVNGHGSNVSSIVASSDSTYRGMAPGANIIHLKVFTNAGGGNFSMIERALQWVVAHVETYNIASVNMSLGDNANYNVAKQLYGISDEIASLAAMNVLMIAAAGNSFSSFASAQGLAYPAADPNVIAVGAVYDSNIGNGWSYASGAVANTTGPDRITPFSQRTTSLYQIFAPGAAITGAGPTGGLLTEHGTSQASPHIAGIAVLAQQLAVQTLGRRLTMSEFRTLLLDTGKPIVDGDDENDNVTNTGATFKRVDVDALGQGILDLAPNGPEIKVLDGSTNLVDGTATVAFGTAITGSTFTKTFTITNTGNQTLTLNEPISVPNGFTVAASFGSTSVAPGASITFTIGVDTSANGALAGTLSFGSNDADEATFNFTVSAVVASTKVLDDGAPGFSTVGAWTVAPGGFQNDNRSAVKGNGSISATWTFSGLEPGRYRLSATWLAAATRATNATYRIYDGEATDTLLLASAKNQQIAANDVTDSGKAFEYLGIVFTSGTTLTVQLTNAANNVVNADAIRLELLSPAPEIVVLDGATNAADGAATVNLGSVETGAASSRTLTIQNTGNASLTLGGSITLPLGFTTSGFGSTTILPGDSTTVTITFNAPVPGARAGAVSFSTNDPDEAPFNFTLSAVAANKVVIDDDSDPTFATIGAWTALAGGYTADQRVHAAGTGTNTASWTFSGLDAGRYRVSAVWSAAANRASNATYTITDGAGTPSTLATKVVNQRVAPASRTIANVAWGDLATVDLGSGGGGTLVVTLSDAANGYVIADAIRIEKLVLLPEINVKLAAAAILDNTGALAFGTTPAGTPVSRTITVLNSGTADLVLNDAITVPTGFTVTSGFGSTTLAPGASTTFTVRLDALVSAATGPKSGTLSFSSNDFDEETFNFAISGTVTNFVAILDDGATGFSTSGAWTTAAGGFSADSRSAAAGAATATATWTFSGLAAGQYRVSAVWSANANRTNAAAYTITDGASSPNTLGTATRNQRLAPASRTANGATWQDLATVTLTPDGMNSLIVTLTNALGGFSIADAIRIEKIA